MWKNHFKIVLLSFIALILAFFIVLYPTKFQESIESIGSIPNGFSKLLRIKQPVEILLTGDVMLGRTVMSKSLDLNDPTYPFKKVGDELRKADIVFINLENPIVTGCPRTSEGLKFCTDPELVKGLTFAGVDVVTLANNHSKNYGLEGLNESVTILNKNGILTTGLGNLVTKKIGGTIFGFLGFDFSSQEPNKSDYDLISEYKGRVDVLIVGVHWGAEYKSEAPRRQKEWAKKFVESGADVVVGHGPHWVQGEEYINGKPVFYSLGNFVFDQMWSEETKQGLAVKLTFRGNKLVKEEKLPVYMSSWAQPEFVEN